MNSLIVVNMKVKDNNRAFQHIQTYSDLDFFLVFDLVRCGVWVAWPLL